MPLFFSLFPLYLFGNLHCIGMCGPLVMMIGRHRFRYFYFLGRTLSFSLAGLFAGEVGAVFNLLLKQYHIPALTSFLFGFIIAIVGVFSICGRKYPGYHWLASKLARANHTLSLLMLRDQPWPAFLFGFFTLSLPCGQTMIVFSACALYGDPFVGLLNGCAFAILTSPSLFAAMHAHRFFQSGKRHYNAIMGVCALIVATLAFCRGLAEMELIPHMILNPKSDPNYHLVIY
jgi:sulfite exporter TauE/SafE